MSIPEDTTVATVVVTRPIRTYGKKKSSILVACRACLSTGMKMLHMKDRHLTEAFKTVTGLLLPENDRSPPYLCIYCCVLINRCISFRKQCLLNENIIKTLDADGKLTLRSIKTVAQGVGRTLTRSEVHTSGYSPEGPADSREGFVDTPGGSGETNKSTEDREDSGELVEVELGRDTPEHRYLAGRVKEEIIEGATEFTDEVKESLSILDQKEQSSRGIEDDIDQSNRTNVIDNSRTIIDSEVTVFEKEPDYVCLPVTVEGNLRVFETDVKMEVLDETISETTPEQLGHEEKEAKTDFTNVYDNIFPNIDIDEHFDPLSTEKCDGPSVSSDCKLDEERVHDSAAVDASEIHESQNAQVYDKEKDKVSTKNSFKCSICNKSLRSKRYLKKHLQIHAKRERFNCDVCSKSFLWKFHLNVHKKRHIIENQLFCDVCGKTYYDKRSLIAHLIEHRGVKPYKCTTCGKTFITKYCLKRHHKQHSTIKPYKCETCDMAFIYLNQLQRHEKKHTGEKPYKCDLCERAFTFRCALSVHKKRIHSRKRAYKCDSCSKAYVTSGDLRRHERESLCALNLM